ncbi:MAG: hypothetical protein AABZ53_13115 [Planctomycetota bacterium]
MQKATLLRRIRCGNLEAIVASITLSDGQARYGAFFQRVPRSDDAVSNVLFDFGELLTLGKLARLAHAAMQSILYPDDEGD